MKRALIGLFVLLCSLSGLSVRAEQAAASQYQALMRKNFIALLELQKLAMSDKDFQDKTQHKKILAYLNTLESNGQHIRQAVSQSQQKPLIAIANIFEEYVSDMPERFRGGYYGYVQQKIPPMTQLCLSCHAGSSAPKSFKGLGMKVDLSGLTPYQKVSFYAATRQFESAVEAMNALSARPELPGDEIYDYNQALKGVLSVLVRLQQDGPAAIGVVQKALRMKGLPRFMKRHYQQWETDLKDWAKDNPKDSKLSAKKLIKKADQLVTSAAKIQDFARDHIADVRFLRASALLQRALNKTNESQLLAQAYYDLGLATAVLRDPLLWDLDQHYFAACIESAPQTSLANQCYEALVNEVFFGYTGSGGTQVPAEELRRLQRLKKLTL